MKNQSNTSFGSQGGASLVVVLILLLIMTLLGLAVLRGTLLEERMSANMYDRSLAFQQAESALREGEERVRDVIVAEGNGWVIGVKCGNDPARGGVTGIVDASCAMPANLYSGGTVCTGTVLTSDCWFNAQDQLTTANNSAGAPQYYVQYMGLRDSSDELGLDSSAGSTQYGGGGGGVVQEAMYRVIARSHSPAASSDRAVVVLQANVVAK
ncbi:pilus assembly PilX family protein [Pseudoxanthomonas sacheonensis]|uniref:Type IV pilus assembly protein PilX n=1 Tax=Pseudoxanthomonas sacheonensis TaxID=443615 RepID=A0ABU1RP16_9GAMM|nr:PilX N-terminal domain-containing pilus assembly protein [Pseudoxanthomonas sacheonensis]MDR6840075.1 type IV pilus assembly protein PilX [Pseudoxanthomonas sacheonensis]